MSFIRPLTPTKLVSTAPESSVTASMEMTVASQGPPVCSPRYES